MNTVNPADLKVKKNCLLVFRNKKVNSFEGTNKLISEFADSGFWFDKISFVAFDKSEEIVRALKDGKENYENTVIVCPKEMEEAVKKFTASLYSAEYDNLGILNGETDSAFVLFSDAANRLTVEDICGTLLKKHGEKFDRAYVKTVGAPADKINSAINKAKSVGGDIDFNISESFGDCTIELIYGLNTPKAAFDGAYRTLLKELNEYVYAIENITLAERLVELLKLRRMNICVAESFTGGGVCKRLVEISGVSEVFYEGLNTYSNEAKAARLGVKEFTLKNYGAVSEQTASEMAEGLILGGNCDVSIATTGIAGPKSDNTNKPVGLIYIAIGKADGVAVYKYNLNGTREEITETAVNLALFLAFKAIK